MRNTSGITRRQLVRASALGVGTCLVLGAAPARAEEAREALPSEALDYLYIDSSSICAGEEQNVVIALLDHDGFTSATLLLTSADGSERTVALARGADNAMLFAFAAEEGAWTVSSTSFADAKGSYCLDLSGEDADVRSFEVASATVSALSETSGSSEGDLDEEMTLQVYSGDDEGEVIESSSIEDAAAVTGVTASSSSARSVERASNVIVALDPGHVAAGSGASGNGLHEEELTWQIAQYCKAELDSYVGVSSFYTVTPSSESYAGDAKGDLLRRVEAAVEGDAAVLVSLHINSSSSGGAYGAEVYAPYDGSYNNNTHTVGEALAERIIGQLEDLGLFNRGVRFRTISNNENYEYADGSDGDYYGIIRYARQEGLPAVIVEHAFISNASDASKFLSSSAKLKKLGIADATGIANYFGLSKIPGAMYRMYNPNSGEHFYTARAYERDSLVDAGWNYEGLGWVAPEKSNTPVYRLYNPNAGDHHYTTSAYERDHLRSVGWNYEGVGWYSDDAKSVAVYRQYNPNARAGAHNFTTSTYERDQLVKAGWHDEGIAWYATETA